MNKEEKIVEYAQILFSQEGNVIKDPKRERTFVIDVKNINTDETIIKNFVVKSGKQAWGSIGAAKNAMRYYMECSHEFSKRMVDFLDKIYEDAPKDRWGGILSKYHQGGGYGYRKCLHKGLCQLLEDKGVIVYRELE